MAGFSVGRDLPDGVSNYKGYWGNRPLRPASFRMEKFIVLFECLVFAVPALPPAALERQSENKSFRKEVLT